MFFKKQQLVSILCGFLLCAVPWSCEGKRPKAGSDEHQRDKKWDRHRAELEYRLIQAELRLARSEGLYLVLDMAREEFQLKLKGALVWNYPINAVNTDSQELKEFGERFLGGDKGRVVRCLSGKHLFTAQDKTPDSVLAVVGEVVKVDPELLQREVPARFQLLWGSGLTLEVRTDIVGKPKSPLKSTLMEFRHALRRPFGEAYLMVKMHPDDAITFYQAARVDLPTILRPSILTTD